MLARANGRRPRNIDGLTRKQMQSLSRALLWSRGERKIDVVDLLAGLGGSDAPNKLVPPEELVAHDGSGQWRRRALGMLVFVLMAGAAVAAFVYLERNPAPQRPAAAPAATPALHGNEPLPAVEGEETAVAKAPPPVEKSAKTQPKVAERKNAAKPAAVPPPRSDAARSTSPVVIEFDKDTYVATESDGSVRIVVERHGSTQRATTFRWNLRSNSAEQGTDFAGIGPGTERSRPARAPRR